VHIGVPLETQTGETRVAATPETIKKLIGQGHKVTVQSGAGINASVVDSTYEAGRRNHWQCQRRVWRRADSQGGRPPATAN
jgi:NAD/NADP transhydrogenase alpha subunit